MKGTTSALPTFCTPRTVEASSVPAGAGQVAKFEDLIEEASAELDRVEAQLQTASQEKVVLQNGNAQLMRQAQESAAVKAQASREKAVVVCLDTGTLAASSCCRQLIAYPILLASDMHLHCQGTRSEVRAWLLTLPILS